MKVITLIIATLLSQIYYAQVADFDASPTSSCSAPRTVFFTDQSTIPDTWAWQFGDGGTSTAQNPIHSYTTAGTFSVQLTIQDTITGITSIHRDTIRIGIPTASIGGPAFGYFGCAPLNVNFVDASSNDGFGTITDYLWNFGDGNTSTSQNPSHVYNNPGTYNVSLTVTNSLGCTHTDVFSNMVQAIGPALSFTADQTSATCTDLAVNFTNTSVSSSPAIGYLWDFGDGNTRSTINASHTYTAYNSYDVSLTINDLDGCSRTLLLSDFIVIEDTEDPTVSCPTDIAINTDPGQCTSTATIGTATGTDNCGTPTITNDAPANFPIGNTTVTWTSTDEAGNFVTCTQIVTVVDTENPTVTCPADIIFNTDPGQCTATATIGTATGTDNCGTATITNDAPASFPIGNTTVTWTSTDAIGNFATCTQIITVVDNENPTITCPTDITLNTDPGQCTSSATIGTATGTDNCGVPTITNDAPTGFPIGNTIVTWTSTDANGNAVNCTQTVTVVDNGNPTISCPADIAVFGDDGCDFIIADYTTLASATDNCTASPIVTQSPVAGTTINGTGNHAITLTATDATGNVDNCTFNLVLVDTVAPTATCLPNQSEILDENCQFILPDYSLNTDFSDNCDSNITSTQTPLPGTVYSGVQNLPVVLTFEDASGNSTTCSFTVDVTTNDLNPGCLDDIVIATLMTPNGDGRNDTWIIRDNDFIKDCTVQIFNRWGQKVFETTNYQNDWNGESNGNKLTDGAYFYLILCNDEIKYSGPLTILNSSN